MLVPQCIFQLPIFFHLRGCSGRGLGLPQFRTSSKSSNGLLQGRTSSSSSSCSTTGNPASRYHQPKQPLTRIVPNTPRLMRSIRIACIFISMIHKQLVNFVSILLVVLPIGCGTQQEPEPEPMPSGERLVPVSYTHLTLPTIYSV